MDKAACMRSSRPLWSRDAPGVILASGGPSSRGKPSFTGCKTQTITASDLLADGDINAAIVVMVVC